MSCALAAADTGIGAIPRQAYVQSRYATFAISPHVVERGQKIVATATARINGAGWNYPSFPGTRVVSGCQQNGPRCVLKATGASGPAGNRVQVPCLDGSSGQGPWVSCDYYAVLAKCKGSPSLDLKHKRHGRDTVIDFQGHNWDTHDCGPVTVTAVGEKGGVPVDTFQRSNFKGTITVHGRLCGLDLYAEQLPNRRRTAGFSQGRRVDAVVLLAHPGDTPQGDHLLPGDFLCENEVGVGQTQMHFITDKFTADDVRTIAGGLGQQLLEVEGHGPVFLADSAGMVSVAGVSLEHIQPDVLANLQDSVVHQNPQNVPGNADSPNLSGYQFSGSSWSVSGDLNLNNAVLLVQGDLNVGGSIKGFGTVIATGNITAAGAQLQAAGKFALAAGGALNLP